MKKQAHIQGDYRYWLTRIWDDSKERVVWIMLNPSTADAVQDDATIRRCIGFAKSWGYGGLLVLNLFALRATNPQELLDAHDPVGPNNQAAIEDALAKKPSLVIAAWGAHKAVDTHEGYCQKAWLMKTCAHYGVSLKCMGYSKSNKPLHPLRLPKTTQPELYW